ncbi:thioredoxin [candidate division WOR-3 bacterium]|uniref:Thioredoxin n=1 Tax=candidate division WOR-3 bacterium TaxID=2052148 RepID=A0A9D5KAZ7_UNCW3|nr:thioredoxin [candidate division WOR-3 bacterium]MBD3365390.1 thioredoxin [candidate division WOR-3 bacterium]
MIQIKTAEEFKKEVLQAEIPVVVDFWADWCPPCKMLAPVMEELARDYDGKAKVVKVDVDQVRELAGKYEVMSIPTVLFFKQGKVCDINVGAVPKAVLAEKIDSLLSG